MTIKQSILLLLLPLGVSFNAFAGYWTYYHQGATERFTTQAAALSYGKSNKFKDSYYCYSLKSITNETSSYVQGYWIQYDKSCSSVRNTNAYYQLNTKYVSTDACSPGQELNDSTGKCETPPPTCGPDEQLNPDSLECEPVPFCDRDSTNDQLFQAEQSCAAQGGIFSFQCSNGGVFEGPEGLQTKCTQPNECVMGYPNWPDCLGDLDPTDPLPDPDSNFDSGTAEPITPDNPSFDKTEPDAVTPTDTTDTAVLEAVQNLNRDTNQGFKALNADMNQGFNDVNNQLNRLNQTNNAIGQSIVDQMNQDYRAHLAQKGLLLQQTGAINNGMSSIVKSIGEQTGTLNDSLTGIGKKLDELNLNIKDSAPCDPNEDPLSCEGEHGLGEPTVGTINTQINHAVEGMFEESEAGMIGAVRGYVDDAGVSSIQTHIDGAIGLAMGALPNISDCTSFSMPTPFGDSIDFGCEFSVKFKAVASFLMYIYTAWTLIDILLTGVTPAAGTVPYMSRR